MRKTYKGKVYTVITSYKPTKKEALQLMASKMDSVKESKIALTFSKAFDNYIASKSNVLSPCTIRGYKVVFNNLPEWFSSMRISDIEAEDIQRCVNEYAKDRKPKTVRNMHGLVSAILSLNRPNMVINTTLPQKAKDEPYIPSSNDVKAVLENAKGTEWEVAIWLAVYGLRRSEILALEYPTDLKGNILTINKALVPNDKNEYVLKGTKTADSTREIYLPDNVVELIHSKKCFINNKCNPNSLSDYLATSERALGLHHFSLHKLRHYYASMAHTMGIPDKYIQSSGGWKTDSVMKTVYRHAQQESILDNQRKYAECLSKIL